MGIWPVQDAKARFSEFLDTCLEDGPQIVSRRGAEAAVLVPIGQWRKLQAASQPSLKDLLLSDTARADLDIPSRSAIAAAGCQKRSANWCICSIPMSFRNCASGARIRPLSTGCGRSPRTTSHRGADAGGASGRCRDHARAGSRKGRGNRVLDRSVASTWNVVPMDARVMRAWARLMVAQQDELIEDGMIAAVAMVHRLTVVTRNVKDFKPFGVRS